MSVLVRGKLIVCFMCARENPSQCVCECVREREKERERERENMGERKFLYNKVESMTQKKSVFVSILIFTSMYLALNDGTFCTL